MTEEDRRARQNGLCESRAEYEPCIWFHEEEGRPEGRQVDHWFASEIGEAE